MREIHVDTIEQTIRSLCIRANKVLPNSLEQCIRCGKEREQSPAGKSVFDDLCANLDAARETDMPICQDTGMAVIFLRIGQDVHITGGDLREAVNRGVAAGYLDGYLRCSVVSDPLERVNTGNNTPAVLHIDIVPGEQIEIDVCPKGFGSENMSALRMLTPAATEQTLIDFVTESIRKAGSNPCPPIVVGVGIGGDFELCAYLAKKALCRDVAKRNPLPRYAELEQKMLDAVNRLGIGPQGFGGTVTALSVNIEQAPTHIAGLPIAVNVGCHVTRHASAVL
ncbi:MAG: fumarate hydratase [Oscillospiraceae bacterium]|nr:fumarate hydratase [Oscillospiraceae bacterium]